MVRRILPRDHRCVPFLAIAFTVSFLLLLPAANAVINTTGNITLDNDNGQVAIGVTPSNGISIIFVDEDDTGERGGGGGGGGGEVSSEPNPCLEKLPSTAHIFDQMTANTTYNLTIRGTAFYLDRLSFSVTVDKPEGATFTLSHVLNIACESIPAVDSDLAAVGYERIDHAGVYKNEIASGVRFEFTIPVAELTALGASPDDLKLYRYDGSNWQPLTTTVLTRGALAATFEAYSPGLSMFAYAVPKRETPEATATTSGSPTGMATGTPATTGTTGATGTPGSDPSGTTGEPGGEGTVASGARSTGKGLLWSIIIVLIIGGALVGYVLYEQRSKIAEHNATVNAAHPQHEPLLGFVDIDDAAFEEAPGPVADPVGKLRRYVDTHLRAGHGREEIAAHLRKSGWPENIIANVLDDLSPAYLATHGMHEPHTDYDAALAFLRRKLAKGYDVEVIKRSLVTVGWDAALIGSLLHDLQAERAEAASPYSQETLQKLRAFIEQEYRHGYTDERITAALVKAGWNERVVAEELARTSPRRSGGAAAPNSGK